MQRFNSSWERLIICTRCLSKLKARCPEKVEALKLRMDSSSRSMLECQRRELVWLGVFAWISLNREEMICFGKCHPNRSSEDIPAFWRLTATLGRSWCKGTASRQASKLQGYRKLQQNKKIIGWNKVRGRLQRKSRTPVSWDHGN